MRVRRRGVLERLLCSGRPIKHIEMPFAPTQSKHVQCFVFFEIYLKSLKSPQTTQKRSESPKSYKSSKKPRSSKTTQELQELRSHPRAQNILISIRRPGGVLLGATGSLGECCWA